MTPSQWSAGQADDTYYLREVAALLQKINAAIATGGMASAGGWTDDGTTIRLTTSTDKVHIGASSAATHTLTVTDSGADSLKVTGTVSTGKTTWIGASDDLFDLEAILGAGLVVKGAGLAYKRSSGTEQFGVKAADDTLVAGLETASINYKDFTSGEEAFCDIVAATSATASIRIFALTTDVVGEVYTGISISDPEGIIIQGKDSGSTNYALQVKNGSDTFGGGTALFNVRNDGLVSIGATASYPSRLYLSENTSNGTSSVTLTVPAALSASKTLALGGYDSGALCLYEPSTLTGVAIGRGAGNATLSGSGSVIIGSSAGTSLTTGAFNTIIGQGAGSILTDGGYNTLIGYNAESGASTSESIAIGYNAVTTADNQLVIGSNLGEITDIYIGSGVTDSSPDNVVLNTTGGSGTNGLAASLTIAAGKATGTGYNSTVKIQTSVPVASGTTVQTLGDREVWMGNYRTLTETSVTQVGTIAIPVGTVAGGQIVVSVEANDGTDFQCRTLSFEYSAVNKAGTITIAITTPTEVVAVSTGTLTATITVADVGGNNCSFYVNATSSLVQTTLRASFQAKKNFGTGAITG